MPVESLPPRVRSSRLTVLACAVVLIAAVALLELAVVTGRGYEPPRAVAGVCGQPPDGTPGNACWRAPQPVSALTGTAGVQCPDADASGSLTVRRPDTAIDTRSLPAPPAPHEIHRRAIPLLI